MARRRCRTPEDAEDLVADAIIAAAKSQVPIAELGPWLTTVTLNMSASVHRRHYRQMRTVARLAALQVPAGEESHENSVVDRMAASDTARLAQRLPARQLQVLLRRGDGASIGTISAEMGVPYKTVESLLSRARETMRRILQSAAALFVLCWAVRPRVTRIAVAGSSVALVLALVPGWLGSAGEIPARPPGVRLVDGPAAQTLVAAVHGGEGAGRNRRRTRQLVVQPRPQGQRSVSRTTLLPRRVAAAGPVAVEAGGAEYRDTDEPLLESLENCLAQGLRIDPERVGCADPSE